MVSISKTLTPLIVNASKLSAGIGPQAFFKTKLPGVMQAKIGLGISLNSTIGDPEKNGYSLKAEGTIAVGVKGIVDAEKTEEVGYAMQPGFDNGWYSDSEQNFDILGDAKVGGDEFSIGIGAIGSITYTFDIGEYRSLVNDN